MATSSIEWTEATWNPVTGCDRVSVGCDNCYALTLARRLKAMGQPKYQRDGDPRTSGPGFGVTAHEDALEEPLRWSRPTLAFVNSMSDLFHQDVSEAFVAEVWDVMARSPQHTFQVLTKRPQRMASLLGGNGGVSRLYGGIASWPLPNVWLGVSIENQQYAEVRIPHLLASPASVRFLSCEPLLGPVDLRRWLDTDGIDWLIVGGESGPRARPMELNWVRDVARRCSETGTSLFVKQLGTVWSSANGHGQSHGTDPSAWPVDLRVREMPAGAYFSTNSIVQPAG
jgi:protein gp37